MKKYHWFLVLVFLAVWAWAAIHPAFRHDWLLENALVFIFVPIIILLGVYFRLSKVSYTLIVLFLCLHLIGAHYTYEHVPFGYTLEHWFGADRNMYDRLVHFSCGFLMFYPVREVFMRIARVKGVWSYIFPIDLWGSFSALYEIIEWLTARNVDPSAGLAFLGSQGDIWDAQKDMLMAIIGATIAASIVFIINWIYKEDFWKDIRESLRIPKHDHELGEVELSRMREKRIKV
jgi:putative membrane protein